MLTLWTVLAAHAAPVTTFTSADISTPGCGEPVVSGQLPAQSALVGTDVVPLVVFDGGNSGIWGWYELDDGAGVVHESEAWADELPQGSSVVRFPDLPALEPDTTYTLTYQPEGGDAIERSFTTGAGSMGASNLPEGPPSPSRSTWSCPAGVATWRCSRWPPPRPCPTCSWGCRTVPTTPPPST